MNIPYYAFYKKSLKGLNKKDKNDEKNNNYNINSYDNAF